MTLLSANQNAYIFRANDNNIYLISIKIYTLKHVFDKLCETDFRLLRR